MKVVRGLELKKGSYEEILPDFSEEFPYIASRVELDQCMGRGAPWHWHKEVEIFYLKQGALEYDTPHGKLYFPEGSGGFVNSNVIHKTRADEAAQTITAFLHLFNPLLISGQSGSTIDQKYVQPLTAASNVEIIPLYPDHPDQASILELLKASFQLTEQEYAYEIRLRAALSRIWCGLLETAKPVMEKGGYDGRDSEKAKAMMTYIHEHYGDKITVADLSAAVYISERECYRVFHDCLNTTPVGYMTGYRIQKACRLLEESRTTITDIGSLCGLGSSSYFGKLFREHMGCTPLEYRSKWQDRDK